MALGKDEIDAASFTTVRLAAGAVTLALISASVGKTRSVFRSGHWASAFFLFAYAICFSFAYLGLTTGMGALILFGSVQLTMVAAAFAKGERPTPLELAGIVIAFSGLVYLVFPGLTAPPLSKLGADGRRWCRVGFLYSKRRGSWRPVGRDDREFRPLSADGGVGCDTFY